MSQQIIFKPHNGIITYNKQLQQKFGDITDSIHNPHQLNNENNQQQEFQEIKPNPISQTNLSLSYASLDNNKMLKINKSTTNKQSVQIQFPKQSKKNKTQLSKHQGCESVRNGSSTNSYSNEYLNQNYEFRGMLYEDIKPKNKPKNVIDKIKDFSESFYNKLFNQESNDQQCTCQSLSNTQSNSNPSLLLPLQESLTPNTCSIGKNWLKLTAQDQQIPNLFKNYSKLQSKKGDSKNIKQIELDIQRTKPFIDKFNSNHQKLDSLRKVLITFSINDPQIGYIQGMNFIASALINHCDDFVAFSLLTHIVQNLQMRDLYLPNLPGLQKHLQIIDYLILKKLGDLYSHFCENQVQVDMFCSPWLFSLFGMMIPLEKMDILLTHIFEQGWTYIYRLIIAFLLYNQELLLSEDNSGIIMILSSQNYKINKDMNLEIDWQELLESALNVEINEQFIEQMHNKYDSQYQRFKI